MEEARRAIDSLDGGMKTVECGDRSVDATAELTHSQRLTPTAPARSARYNFRSCPTS